MSGEVWAFIGVAITAVVGGSGIAGVLTGAVELSQRNRLRRRAEKALALAELLSEKSSERQAVEHAAAVDATRLAALSAVELNPLIRYVGAASAFVTVGYVVLVFAFLATNPKGLARVVAAGSLGAASSLTYGQFILIMAALSVILAIVAGWAFSNASRERRARFVREVLDGRDPKDAATSSRWNRETKEPAETETAAVVPDADPAAS
jgi:hypothetical protein